MRKFALLLFYVLSVKANSAIYWTVKATGGIHTNISGAVALSIEGYTPNNPNPPGTKWEPCNENWIFFNKTANKTEINEKYVDRMLSVALAAYKTNARIRVAVERGVLPQNNVSGKHPSAVLINSVPELAPPLFGQHQRSQAQYCFDAFILPSHT